MHGCGNDYIYINGFEETIENPSQLAQKMSPRHFAVGSDGLVLILPSETADFRMRMFNADGSEAEMCGNAIRCVGKYVFDNQMTAQDKISIETLAGIKILDMTIENHKVSYVTVDMGEPILDPKDIPVISEQNPVIGEIIPIEEKVYPFTCVSMGNPHAVTFVEDVDSFPLEHIGPQVENHPAFPKKVNAEFVQLIDEETVKMRVWERGSGETFACGTGACATVVACVLNKKIKRRATVQLLGGDLLIEWNEKDNHIYMTGPAATVYEGVWE